MRPTSAAGAGRRAYERLAAGLGGAAAIASALLLPVLPGAAASAQLVGDRADSTAVVATSPVARGGELRAAVEIRVAEGFHVNANPASEDFLIATEVSLADTNGFSVSEIFYPPAHQLTFGFWDGPLRVWEGSVVAAAVLDVNAAAPLGFRDLEFVILYQACNDEACFAPAETRYTVAVEVVEAGSATRQLVSPLMSRARFEHEPAEQR